MNHLAWACAAALLAGLVGCIPEYKQPAINAPHALVKVRMAFHEKSGPNRTDLVTIDGNRVSSPEAQSDEAAMRAVRVAPGSRQVEVSSTYWHTESRLEGSSETEYYSCGSQRCSRQVFKQKNVEKQVIDGACKRELQLNATQDEIYLLQFDYYDRSNCTFQCLRQLPKGQGEFKLVPCEGEAPTLPPPPDGQ